MEAALSHRGFDVHPMSNEVITEQQGIADTFKDLGLIPVAVNVPDAVRRSPSDHHHYRFGTSRASRLSCGTRNALRAE
jgi:hypothetical protein